MKQLNSIVRSTTTNVEQRIDYGCSDYEVQLHVVYIRLCLCEGKQN